MSKKGFTLVELLAVIVVLGIILVIAILNVIKIINQSRFDVYKKNEDLLISSTRNYLTQNGISLQDNQNLTVSYSTLKSNNLIDPIRDITSKNECINSKVYITKISSGYTYKTGLVCDNYISLDTFDLLKGYGNFEIDSDNDGKANEWNCNCSAGVYSVSSTEFHSGVHSQLCALPVNSTVTLACLYTPYNTFFASGVINPTHKYYARSSFKKINGTGYISYNINDYTTSSGNYVSDIVRPIGQWYTFSGIIDMSKNINNNLGDNYKFIIYTNMGGTTVSDAYIDDAILLDLTEIYGVGNEPAKEVMDKLFND